MGGDVLVSRAFFLSFFSSLAVHLYTFMLVCRHWVYLPLLAFFFLTGIVGLTGFYLGAGKGAFSGLRTVYTG